MTIRQKHINYLKYYDFEHERHFGCGSTIRKLEDMSDNRYYYLWSLCKEQGYQNFVLFEKGGSYNTNPYLIDFFNGKDDELTELEFYFYQVEFLMNKPDMRLR